MTKIPDYVRPGGKSYVSPEGVVYCTDGKLRWAHAYNQVKRPTKLVSLVCKWGVAGVAAGLAFLLVKLATQGVSALWNGVQTALVLTAVGVGIALAAYVVNLLRQGIVVCLLFTVDGESVSCQQVKGEADKEKVTREFAAWVGGQSQPALQFRGYREARLDRVTALEVSPAHDCIRLRGAKGLGSVLVEPQQVQSVLDYLTDHCPNLKSN